MKGSELATLFEVLGSWARARADRDFDELDFEPLPGIRMILTPVEDDEEPQPDETPEERKRRKAAERQRRRRGSTSRSGRDGPSQKRDADHPSGVTKSVTERDSGHASDDETIIPLDLVTRARRAGVFVELVARMPGVVVSQLERKAERYVGYWSIGGGAGKRRRHWMSRLRQELLEAYDQGKLPPPEEPAAPPRVAPRIAGPVAPAAALAVMPDVLARVVKPRAPAPTRPVDASGDLRDAERDLDPERSKAGHADGEAVANG